MKKIQIHQTDAFTRTLFGGNPAAVVLEAVKLTADEMKHIAREMNLSETAFVLKPTTTDADFKLRYFTCGKDEVAFCGHATIATLYEIGRTGAFGTKKPGEYSLRVQTNVGILPMKIIKNSENDIKIMFTSPVVRLQNYHDTHKTFAKRLGIPFESIDTHYPIMIEKNLNDIHCVIKSLKHLGDLQFNFSQIITNFKNEGIVVFSLITPETFDKKNDIHVRGLAPLVGVPEDPFTGRLQGAIATYASVNKLLPAKKKSVRTEQGHFLERPGFATTQLTEGKNKELLVFAEAVHVFTGEISI